MRRKILLVGLLVSISVGAYSQVFQFFPDLNYFCLAPGKVAEFIDYSAGANKSYRKEWYDLYGNISRIEERNSDGDISFIEYSYEGGRLNKVIYGVYGWNNGAVDYTKRIIEKEILIVQNKNKVNVRITMGGIITTGDGTVSQGKDDIAYHVKYSDGLTEDFSVVRSPGKLIVKYAGVNEKRNTSISKTLSISYEQLEYILKDNITSSERRTVIRLIDQYHITQLQYLNGKLVDEMPFLMDLDQYGSWVKKTGEINGVVFYRKIDYWQ